MFSPFFLDVHEIWTQLSSLINFDYAFTDTLGCTKKGVASSSVNFTIHKWLVNIVAWHIIIQEILLCWNMEKFRPLTSWFWSLFSTDRSPAPPLNSEMVCPTGIVAMPLVRPADTLNTGRFDGADASLSFPPSFLSHFIYDFDPSLCIFFLQKTQEAVLTKQNRHKCVCVLFYSERFAKGSATLCCLQEATAPFILETSSVYANERSYLCTLRLKCDSRWI